MSTCIPPPPLTGRFARTSSGECRRDAIEFYSNVTESLQEDAVAELDAVFSTGVM